MENIEKLAADTSKADPPRNSPPQESVMIGWLHENPKFGREITFDKDVAGLEEHRGWIKTPLYALSQTSVLSITSAALADAIAVLRKLEAYAPDVGVDEFHAALNDARDLIAKAEGR